MTFLRSLTTDIRLLLTLAVLFHGKESTWGGWVSGWPWSWEWEWLGSGGSVMIVACFYLWQGLRLCSVIRLVTVICCSVTAETVSTSKALKRLKERSKASLSTKPSSCSAHAYGSSSRAVLPEAVSYSLTSPVISILILPRCATQLEGVSVLTFPADWRNLNQLVPRKFYPPYRSPTQDVFNLASVFSRSHQVSSNWRWFTAFFVILFPWEVEAQFLNPCLGHHLGLRSDIYGSH